MILADIRSIRSIDDLGESNHFFFFFCFLWSCWREKEKQRENPITFATNTSSSFNTDIPLRRLQDALHGLFLPRLHRVLLLLSASYSIVNYFSSFTSHPVHIRPSFCVVHVQSNICIAYTKSGTRRKNENSSPWP